jgi:hypothetical protein
MMPPLGLRELASPAAGSRVKMINAQKKVPPSGYG